MEVQTSETQRLGFGSLSEDTSVDVVEAAFFFFFFLPFDRSDFEMDGSDILYDTCCSYCKEKSMFAHLWNLTFRSGSGQVLGKSSICDIVQ